MSVNDGFHRVRRVLREFLMEVSGMMCCASAILMQHEVCWCDRHKYLERVPAVSVVTHVGR